MRMDAQPPWASEWWWWRRWFCGWLCGGWRWSCNMGTGGASLAVCASTCASALEFSIAYLPPCCLSRCNLLLNDTASGDFLSCLSYFFGPNYRKKLDSGDYVGLYGVAERILFTQCGRAYRAA